MCFYLLLLCIACLVFVGLAARTKTDDDDSYSGNLNEIRRQVYEWSDGHVERQYSTRAHHLLDAERTVYGKYCIMAEQ